MSVFSDLPWTACLLAEEHLPLLMAVEAEAYPDPWTQGMFRQEITNRSSFFYLFFKEEALIGYGGFWLVLDEIHITKLTVAAPFRRQGYGRAVLEYLLREGEHLEAETVRLEVREHNLAARQLYQQAGFEEVAMRYGYYARTGENAVLMRRRIVEES